MGGLGILVRSSRTSGLFQSVMWRVLIGVSDGGEEWCGWGVVGGKDGRMREDEQGDGNGSS